MNSSNNNNNNNRLESSSRHDSHEDGLVKYYGCWQRIFINLIVITNIKNNHINVWDGFTRFIWTLIRFFIIIIIIVFGLICWSTVFEDNQQLKQQLEQQYKQQNVANLIIIIIIIEVVKRIIIIKRSYAYFFKATATILNLSYFWTPIAFYLTSYY